MYDKADVFTDDRLFSWIKKLRRLLAGSIIDHILEDWKKEAHIGSRVHRSLSNYRRIANRSIGDSFGSTAVERDQI